MESYINKENKYHLILNEKERKLLKGLMQNALLENESDDITELRKKLFEALKSKNDFIGKSIFSGLNF